MNDKIDIPSAAEVDQLDSQSAKGLLKQLVVLVSTLYGLIDELRQTIASQREAMEAQHHQIAQFQRALFGPKKERVEPVERERKAKQKKDETPEEAQKRAQKAKERREKNAQKKRDEAKKVRVDHPIVDSECSECGHPSDEASRLGDAVSYIWEFVPAHFELQEHHQERAVCACGCFLYGPTPERVADGVIYGPGLHADVAVSKCDDSLPIERQAKRIRRAGIPMSRSSLNDVFHRTAELLTPIWRRILELIAQSEHVSADETPIKVQDKGKCRKGWMWTFIARGLVAYVFSASRSGQTPVDVLGETSGTIQVDGYSGYNTISCPEGRTRCGCWAHARRKFWDALKYAPKEARWVLDQILKLYEVEYEAHEKKIMGSEAHKFLRQAKSKPLVDGLFEWLDDQKDIWPPKSPLGEAIKYAINQKEPLSHFLDEPKVRLDNNLSERHLRLVALGRKNFLFVGHDTGGKNLAILQTIVASCVANKINPQEYLTDVIMRVQHHPQSRIDELLPDQWKPPG